MTDLTPPRYERMNDLFEKWHLEDAACSLHRFSGTYPDEEWHTHPFAFTSLVTRGGYLEELFNQHTGETRLVLRPAGRAHYHPHHIAHRIVQLTEEPTYTIFWPDPEHPILPVYFFRWGEDNKLYRRLEGTADWHIAPEWGQPEPALLPAHYNYEFWVNFYPQAYAKTATPGEPSLSRAEADANATENRIGCLRMVGSFPIFEGVRR